MSNNDKYKTLDKYSDSSIKYIINHEYDGSEESLDWISTGYMILSNRQNKDYSSYVTNDYLNHIKNIIRIKHEQKTSVLPYD